MIEVSTIIPAHNAECTIAQAIDSALSQDCEDHEVVVVNDGSTDSTAGILASYGARIRVIYLPNGGPAKARNAGVRHSTGKYLAFLDADDVWLAEKLKTMVPALRHNPEASLAFSEYRYIDSDGAECGGSSLGHAPSMDELTTPRLLPLLPSTWVIPRQALERTGGFCEVFDGAGLEDLWTLLLLRESGEFAYVPESLTLYRVGHSGELADKYAPAYPVFIALVKQRYGRRGKRWIRSAKNTQCRSMLSKMAHQMNNGDRLGALRTLARIARFRPAYFLGSEFRGRLFFPQNLKRLRNLVAILNRSEQRS